MISDFALYIKGVYMNKKGGILGFIGWLVFGIVLFFVLFIVDLTKWGKKR